MPSLQPASCLPKPPSELQSPTIAQEPVQAVCNHFHPQPPALPAAAPIQDGCQATGLRTIAMCIQQLGAGQDSKLVPTPPVLSAAATHGLQSSWERYRFCAICLSAHQGDRGPLSAPKSGREPASASREHDAMETAPENAVPAIVGLHPLHQAVAVVAADSGAANSCSRIAVHGISSFCWLCMVRVQWRAARQPQSALFFQKAMSCQDALCSLAARCSSRLEGAKPQPLQ